MPRPADGEPLQLPPAAAEFKRLTALGSSPAGNDALAALDRQSSSEMEGPICRICYGAEEVDMGPRGSLIQPCRCTGSVAHVHVSCLCEWRRMRWQQQGFRKSQQCEMCHTPYQIPASHQQYFYRELLGSALPGPRQCLRMLAHRLRSPGAAAELVLDVWLHWVLCGGLQRGAATGQSSFLSTMSIGSAIIRTQFRGFPPRNLPQGAARTFLQPLAALGTLVFLGCASVEVVLVAGAAAYCGAIYGFGAGAAGAVRATWVFGRRLLGGHLFGLGRALLAALPATSQ